MLGLIWDSHRKGKSRFLFLRKKRDQRQEQIKQKILKRKKKKADAPGT